jgi:hypothetical protein
MATAIPGARGLFSLLQEAFRHRTNHRVPLTPALHELLADFRWMYTAIKDRPTRLYELVPTAPSIVGAHDASGYAMGGVLLPTAIAVPRTVSLLGPPPADSTSPQFVQSRATGAHPILWRAKFPTSVRKQLVTFRNPTGTISNSDLELAGSVVQNTATVQCFDVRERTVLHKTDNTATVFWQRKGSTTTTGPPAYLLRLQAYHQRYHRYLPRSDYLEGPRNAMADDASRLFDLSDQQLLTYFNSTYPQEQSWRLWTPPPKLLFAVTTSLHRTPSNPASFLRAPRPPMHTGESGQTFASPWPSIPLWQMSKIPSVSSKSLRTDTAPAPLLPAKSRYDLEQWKMSYGALDRRSLVWGPSTPAKTPKATLTSVSSVNSAPTAETTRLPIESNPSR